MVSRRRRLTIRIVILALLAIAGTWLLSWRHLPTYRYELAVEVDTPQGLRRGSSIIEVQSNREPRILPDMTGLSTDISGEAVAVDLPGGQTLFATLVGENGSGYAEEIALASLVPASRSSSQRGDSIERLMQTTEPALVPRFAYPLLVRFRDIGQPSTAEGVDPDNLAAAFGPDVRLRRIAVRRVDSDPTFTLQSRLPWLGRSFGVIARASNGVGTVLRSEAFQRR